MMLVGRQMEARLAETADDMDLISQNAIAETKLARHMKLLNISDSSNFVQKHRKDKSLLFQPVFELPSTQPLGQEGTFFRIGDRSLVLGSRPLFLPSSGFMLRIRWLCGRLVYSQ